MWRMGREERALATFWLKNISAELLRTPVAFFWSSFIFFCHNLDSLFFALLPLGSFAFASSDSVFTLLLQIAITSFLANRKLVFWSLHTTCIHSFPPAFAVLEKVLTLLFLLIFNFICKRNVVLLDTRIDGLCNGPSLKRDKKICRKTDKFGELKKKNPIKICSCGSHWNLVAK